MCPGNRRAITPCHWWFVKWYDYQELMPCSTIIRGELIEIPPGTLAGRWVAVTADQKIDGLYAIATAQDADPVSLRLAKRENAYRSLLDRMIDAAA